MKKIYLLSLSDQGNAKQNEIPLLPMRMTKIKMTQSQEIRQKRHFDTLLVDMQNSAVFFGQVLYPREILV